MEPPGERSLNEMVFLFFILPLLQHCFKIIPRHIVDKKYKKNSMMLMMFIMLMMMMMFKDHFVEKKYVGKFQYSINKLHLIPPPTVIPSPAGKHFNFRQTLRLLTETHTLTHFSRRNMLAVKVS